MWKWKAKWKSFSRVWLFVTTWTKQSKEFFRPEYWVGSLSLLLGIFPTQGSNPGLQHCWQILYQLSHQGSPLSYVSPLLTIFRVQFSGIKCIHPVLYQLSLPTSRASQAALVVENPPVNSGDMRDAVWSLGQEDFLEEGMATHSSILAWRIPWTEEPGGLQSMAWQRVGQTKVT